MMVYILIFIAIVAFLMGYFLGSISMPEKTPKKIITGTTKVPELIEEYHNFLNYDGTQQ